MTDVSRSKVRVAIFDDSDFIISAYRSKLNGKANVVTSESITTVQSAIEIFEREFPDIVVTDLCLTPGHTEGVDILREIKRLCPWIPVALSTSVWPGTDPDTFQRIHDAHFDLIFQKADLINLRKFVYQNLRSQP